MNEESLSALLDGECSPSELDRLLRRMDHDPALRERFSRLVLAQEVRRGGRPQPLRADFADRVLAALPGQAPSQAPRQADVVELRPRARPQWQPVATLAVAAGLVGVAVLVVKPDPTVTPGAAPAPTLAEAPAPADDLRLSELDDENARQLRNYVMAYSQSRAQHGVGGTLGYARYAAYSVNPADDPATDGSR